MRKKNSSEDIYRVPFIYPCTFKTYAVQAAGYHELAHKVGQGVVMLSSHEASHERAWQQDRWC